MNESLEALPIWWGFLHSGAAMANTGSPTKEQVRDYMLRRQAAHVPPPTPEQVREQLGMKILDAQRRANTRR